MEKAQMHSIRTDVEKIVKATAEPDAKLMKICQLLKETVDHYDWVGFYLVDTAQQGELVLGPFVGAPTEHQRIRFGQGICGQAAETEETFIIQDVAQDVFFAIYKGVARYDASQSFLKWARGVARNTARTYFSTRRRREEVHRQFRSQVRAEIAESETASPAFDSPHHEHLEGCIERLTENQRRVLDCRYKQGMTSRRIAEALDMKAITVRQMLARMRAALRDCLTGKLEAQGA